MGIYLCSRGWGLFDFEVRSLDWWFVPLRTIQSHETWQHHRWSRPPPAHTGPHWKRERQKISGNKSDISKLVAWEVDYVPTGSVRAQLDTRFGYSRTPKPSLKPRIATEKAGRVWKHLRLGYKPDNYSKPKQHRLALVKRKHPSFRFD